MNDGVSVLDVVALTEDIAERVLVRGQVGTVVERLAPGVVEIEFSDETGRMYASAAVEVERLMVLHYETSRSG